MHPDPAPSPTALDALIDRQAGVLTREQAVAAGFTPAAVDDRLRLRRWRPLHPRVYLVRGSLGPRARAWAALLWAGSAAVLSGPTAAWLHGLLDEPPDVVTITVPSAGRRCRPRAGVVVRVRELGPVDVTRIDGLPATGLPLTVLDTAVALGPALLDRALRGRVRFPALRAAHRRMRGAPGAARAALLLDAAAERSATEAVRLLARLLHASGQVGWRFTPSAAGDPPRIAFPAAGLLVEPRGWAGPAGPTAAGGDAQKVLAYTWHDLVERPSIVLAEIAGAAVVRSDDDPSVISATSGRPAGPLGEQARPAAGYPES